MSFHIVRLATNVSYLFAAGERIPILAYHRICPLYYRKSMPWANVYPEEFERQMGYLAEHFECITVLEYVLRVTSGRLTGREICVTFDDGFRDNYLYAFPILRRYGIKATFFLVTAYIGEDIIFPWMSLDDGSKNDIAVNRERWLPLTWDHVREMARYEMEFGTHSHTHSTSLSNLNRDDAKKEIEICTSVFREKMQSDPTIFCYPHGTFKDYDESHIAVLKACGYKAALTTNIGRNSSCQSLYELRRLIVYDDDSLWEFRKKASGAYDFFENLHKAWLTIAGAQPYNVRD